MSKIRATPTPLHRNNKGHMISDRLKKTNYVLIRNDAYRTPLQLKFYIVHRNISHYQITEEMKTFQSID